MLSLDTVHNWSFLLLFLGEQLQVKPENLAGGPIAFLARKRKICVRYISMVERA